MTFRRSHGSRATSETDITMSFDLDGSGKTKLNTGDPLLNHLLDTFATHGHFNLAVNATGDLDVDTHHTIEDTAITLGKAFSSALGTKPTITRFADRTIPMDDARATATIDISNRPYYTCDSSFSHPYINETPTQMYQHFFRSFATTARITLHHSFTGQNPHHELEALFKATALALNDATQQTTYYPTTKNHY